MGRGERGQPKRSQTRGNRAAASKKKETGAKEGSDRPSKGAADGATKKVCQSDERELTLGTHLMNIFYFRVIRLYP